MPKACPDFLSKMLKELTYGEAVIGKKGNLIITKSIDGRTVTVRHFGTKTLEIDFWQVGAEQIVYQYGESQTDARYLKAILQHFNLSHYFDIGYGNSCGWRFSLVKDKDGGSDLPKKEWIHDWNYKGKKVTV